MAKVLRIGEEREVGVEVSNDDGSNFCISDASYKYKDSDDSILAEGEAVVDGQTVSALLKPLQEGYSQRVEFKFSIIPLDENGNTDRKNIQVFEPVIERISVKP